MAHFATALPVALKNDFTATMKTLRNPAFQDLLLNYKRPDRRFLKAYEAEDEVSSDWLIRDGVGNEYKPADYLALFAQFVKENPAQVEAIRILLDRPQDWSTAALSELRDNCCK